MQNAIEIRGVSKEYFRGSRHGHTRVTELLADWGRSLIGSQKSAENTKTDIEPFWALKDISFTIERGQVVGIIGRNGSGKSTLLKIVAQITAPTTGEIRLNGRIGTLLEVGTGFHPELSGRENVFLNGAILGMSHTEIAKKFDEIVDFSGIEAFIDTPVKRYSSGMQTRLAFSVAAHLEPEILIIDEVLAVGDAEFQKRCLGKMKNVTNEGRTVLFVSHSMPTITSLCSHCILLENGRMEAQGLPHQISDLYFSDGGASVAAIGYKDTSSRPGNDIVQLCGARILNQNGEPADAVRRDDTFAVEMTFEVKQGGHKLVPNFHILLQDQYVLVSSPPNLSDSLAPGTYRSVMWLPPRFLNNGVFVVGVAVSSMGPVVVHFFEQDALRFHVIDDLLDEGRHDYIQEYPGVVRPDLKWDIRQEQ